MGILPKSRNEDLKKGLREMLKKECDFLNDEEIDEYVAYREQSNFANL
jgi:hypothetical protein